MARKGKVILAPLMGGFWVELDKSDGLYHWKAEFKASKRIFVSKGYKKSYRAAMAAKAKGMVPRFDADGAVMANKSPELV